MRFYLDTEFNGHGGELVSLALVSQWSPVKGAADGRREEFHWYAARRIKSQPVPWVKENVYPVLRCHFLSSNIFKHDFQQFILQFPDMEVICDWHDDARHFCELLSGEDYTSSLDFPCTIRILKTPPGEPKSQIPHNALADARALRDWHEQLMLLRSWRLEDNAAWRAYAHKSWHER